MREGPRSAFYTTRIRRWRCTKEFDEFGVP